jgi:hypothetical protein
MNSSECLLRTNIALNNVPPTRINIVSPYPSFTRPQLDMRRKVEILKYSNNNSSSKTNNFSKKQQWSMLVNGITKNSSQAIVSSELPEVLECPLDDLIPTSSSSCDVPGKSILLQLDPTIPLYNYK